MARKKAPTIDVIPDMAINPVLEDTQNLMSIVTSQYNDERDLVNQLLGQAQIAGAFEQFSRTVRISKLAYVKENKLYRQVKGIKLRTGSECLRGTWEEFCNLLGMSVDKADYDILNLNTFGEEALESMSRMGIGYRELRQFRRLPEDQKSALIEVAKEGDKTALLELAEEMIAKHAKEKEELKADLEVSRQMLAEKKEVINVMSTEREQLKARLIRRSSTETPDEEGEAIETETIGFKNGVLSSIFELECNFKSLFDHTDRSGINHFSIMAATLDDIECRIINLREKYNLPGFREVDGIPDWGKEAQSDTED